jgi:hypothetical protein
MFHSLFWGGGRLAASINFRGRGSYTMELEKYEFVPSVVEKELIAKFNPAPTLSASPESAS